MKFAQFVALSALTMMAAPLAAQDEAGAVAEQKRTVRSVIVYGDDPCPQSTNADEIVVCSRQPERERYRLPRAARRSDAAPAQSWSARARAMDAMGQSGAGSCTPIGPGGHTGCTIEQMRAAQAEKQQVEAQATTKP